MTAHRLYVLHIWGDVEPRLLGPYPNDAACLTAARQVRHADPSQRDGLYRLDVGADGTPYVTPFTGAEL